MVRRRGLGAAGLTRLCPFVGSCASPSSAAVCINPGGREVPAQKPRDFEIELDGFERYRARDIDRRGRLEFEVETDAVGRRIPGAPDCPDPNWTERVREARFLDARVTLRQGNERTSLLYTFRRPTRDGEVRDRDVDCFTP
ncbi:MAG: hypothetical protein R6X02_15195 [Enhygromyxa sp.]